MGQMRSELVLFCRVCVSLLPSPSYYNPRVLPPKAVQHPVMLSGCNQCNILITFILVSQTLLPACSLPSLLWITWYSLGSWAGFRQTACLCSEEMQIFGWGVAALEITQSLTWCELKAKMSNSLMTCLIQVFDLEEEKLKLLLWG